MTKATQLLKQLMNVKPYSIIFSVVWMLCVAPVFAGEAVSAQNTTISSGSGYTLELPSDDRIVIGVAADFPPYSFLDENGMATGYNVDLTRAIAKVMQLNVEVKIGPFGELRQALERGEIDALPMFYSVERDKLVDFSSPFSIVHNAIFMRRDTPAIETEDDLRGKDIIVIRGDIIHDYVLENNISDNPVLAATESDALRLLASGKHDCALMAQLPGLYWTKELGLANVKIVGPLLRPSKTCYAVPEGNITLQHLLSEGLAVLVKTGAHQKIHDKWLGVLVPGGVSRSTILKYITFTVVPLLLLLALSIIWFRTLKRQVIQRTRELSESEERYRAVAEDTPALICRFLPNGEITYVNGAYCKYFEKTAEDLVGQTLFSLIHEAERETVMANISAMTVESPNQSHEHQVIGAKGEIRWTSWTNRALFDAQGKAVTYQSIGKDITERKQAEEALQESEERFRLIYENIAVGVAQVSLGFRIECANKSYCRMLGYREDELIGKHLKDITHQETVEENLLKQSQLAADKIDHYRMDKRFIHKSGRVVDGILDANLVRDGEGKPLYFLGSVLDITDRKQAEEELRANRDYLEKLTNSIWDAVFSVKMPERVIEWVNDSFKLIGYEPNECVGKNTSFLYPDKDGFLDFGNKLKNAMAAGKDVLQTEHLLIRKNGKTFPADITVTFHKENGQVISVTSIIRDITERKRVEVAVQESQATLLTVLDSMDATIYVADMETYEILFMNKHMKDSFGGDFTGKNCWEAFRHEPGPCGHCTNDKLLDEEGNPTGVQVWNDQNPVTGKWFINYDRAIKWSDGCYVRLQVATDITDLKKMEEQLRQAQKMEAIGILAGGVAHDFNNILTTIIGNAHMALMEVGKDGPLREELEEIKIAGERASGLTRQLLAFSRKQVIQAKILDLNELLTGTEKMLGRLISEDVEILIIKESALWQVEADPGQIEQVIMNLVVNARDVMPMGGKLTIETANVDLDENYFRKHGIKEDQPGTYVMLVVSDTGSGMDKETQEHIFEPFYTTKEQGKGTGLGLSTVYGIVKQNNGFIWVYSEPGQGSTFKVYLPRVKENIEAEEKKLTHVAELSGSETVLIVEDDDSLRKIANKALQQKGYKVLEAENGKNALKICKDHDGLIDLMITDVVMPKMSGREVAERLQPLYPNMKVIYMSGYTDNAIVHHGVLAPGLNFIEKPFTPEGLARKVREAIDSED